MGQHFLLSAAARSVSLRKVLSLTDDEAQEFFSVIRWGSKDQQTCPHCGVIRNHRYVRLQKRWRCRDCYKAFSVTSGTLFNHHKLPLQILLGAIVLYANAAKGLSALQMSRELDVQYKTAYVLLHKLRETLWKTRDKEMLEGEVEIDGGYMHTYVRPKNKAADRPDIRLAGNQNPNKCVVLVLRQRHTDKGHGAKRTRIFVLKSENERDVIAIARANIREGSKIITDEAPAYTALGAYWDHSVVNHSKEYRAVDGANENQTESYISRFRRMLMGQIHRLHRKYLDVYANEIAFREDRRRVSNGCFTKEVLIKCLGSRPSRDWKGYWQGNKRYNDPVMRFA